MKEITPNIEVLPARNGQPTVRKHSANGQTAWLHSAFDPGREAASLVSRYNLERAGAVVVFGLGLGYHIIEILLHVGSKVPVLVVENDQELISVTRKCKLPIAWNRVTVVNKEEEIKLFLFRCRDALREKQLVLIDHPPSVRLSPEYFSHMRYRVRDYVSALLVEVNTARALNSTVQKNIFANLPGVLRDPGVAALAATFHNKPAVIVSAGPSLGKNIHLLAEAKNRSLIICVGTALKAMLIEGLNPDLIVTMDPTVANHRLFENLPPTDAFLCYEPQTYHKIPPLFEGRRFAFNAFSPPLQVWLRKYYGPKGYAEPGGSVAITAFGIACLFGCNPITFIGQDLAYTNGYTHAKGTVYEGRRVKLDESPDFLEVPAISGGKVWTSRGMHTFLLRFEELFARHSDRLIINATEGGALKRGTKVMTFREALDTYFTEEVPALEIIAAKHREASQPRPEVSARVREELEKTLEEYRAWLPVVEEVVSTARGIVDMAETLHVSPEEPSGDRFAAGAARHLEEEAARLNALLKQANAKAKLIDLLSLLTFDAHLAKEPADDAPLLNQVRHVLKLYDSYRNATKTMIGQLEETLTALAAGDRKHGMEGAVNQ